MNNCNFISAFNELQLFAAAYKMRDIT